MDVKPQTNRKAARLEILKLKELPSWPAVAQQLLQSLATEHAEISELSDCIEKTRNWPRASSAWRTPLTSGDKVLCEVANLLQRNIREGDILARFGGDEFIVALANTNCDGAKLLAERIRAGMAGIRIKHESVTISVTASVGIAGHEGKSSEKSSDLLDRLIRRADEALYECNRRGRNWVYVYERSDDGRGNLVPANPTDFPSNLH